MQTGMPPLQPREPAWLTHRRLSALALVLGALVGFPLGIGIRYFGSIPMYGSDSAQATNVFLLLGGGVILAISLGVWAVIGQSIIPLVAAAAMVVAGLFGSLVAPGGPGSAQAGSGTGSAGTRQAPTAFWSGSVSCEWQKGQDSTVTRVVGFEVLVRDPAVAQALGIDAGSKVVAIVLGRPDNVLAGLGVGENRDNFMGEGSQLALEGLNRNRSAGSAVATGAAIVFGWSCSQGP